jgi:hypothetical protein
LHGLPLPGFWKNKALYAGSCLHELIVFKAKFFSVVVALALNKLIFVPSNCPF